MLANTDFASVILNMHNGSSGMRRLYDLPDMLMQKLRAAKDRFVGCQLKSVRNVERSTNGRFREAAPKHQIHQ